ncbi:MAG: xanthine dehydrogenase family protein subunit M [Candidatus Riflebacteria bacterium]|nr:xanthine dehydrogenase family protein subunit M [Candidatus Riflebacteria bacterium]
MKSYLGFIRPTSITETIAFLNTHPGARIVSGGTDFIVKWKNGLMPDVTHLVDLGALSLDRIEISNGTVSIGSTCTMAAIAADTRLTDRFPALVEAGLHVGAPQIRNMATLGGNIANASPSGDTIPALMSLDASIVLSGPDGERRIEIAVFFTGPGKTVMKRGELITSIELADRKTRGTFLKLGERRAHAISKVSAAVSTWAVSGARPIWRVALGAVAPTVIRARRAETLLEGNSGKLDADTLERVKVLVSEDAKPIDDIRSQAAYRRRMTGVLVSRAVAAIS